MNKNRYWSETDGCYELHFNKYYDDTVVLKFTVDNKDPTCFWFVSEEMNIEYDCEWYDSVDEAKAEFELKYEQHLQDQIAYYKDVLKQWEESKEQ